MFSHLECDRVDLGWPVQPWGSVDEEGVAVVALALGRRHLFRTFLTFLLLATGAARGQGQDGDQDQEQFRCRSCRCHFVSHFDDGLHVW